MGCYREGSEDLGIACCLIYPAVKISLAIFIHPFFLPFSGLMCWQSKQTVMLQLQRFIIWVHFKGQLCMYKAATKKWVESYACYVIRLSM